MGMMTRNEVEQTYEAAYEAWDSPIVGDRHDAGLLAVAAEAAKREREAAASAVAAVSLDAMREVGMQCDSYHEAMRALFVRAVKETP
jgi:hypothetical protein